jgi:hypothetical protein
MHVEPALPPAVRIICKMERRGKSLLKMYVKQLLLAVAYRYTSLGPYTERIDL